MRNKKIQLLLIFSAILTCVFLLFGLFHLIKHTNKDHKIKKLNGDKYTSALSIKTFFETKRLTKSLDLINFINEKDKSDLLQEIQKLETVDYNNVIDFEKVELQNFYKKSLDFYKFTDSLRTKGEYEGKGVDFENYIRNIVELKGMIANLQRLLDRTKI